MSANRLQKRIIEGLRETSAYPHPVDNPRVIETHISWVILTGENAYKIKKAVRFGFLDFSTLEKRKRYCEEELRLNRRFAPDMYREVVPITGTTERPVVGGDGKALEYAVRMRQFDQQLLLDQLARRGELDSRIIDEMAAVIARFHEKADRNPPDPAFGSPARVSHWSAENFEEIARVIDLPTISRRLNALRRGVNRAFSAIESLLEARRGAGWVRECHGDLHLGNMALIDQRVTPFDCIEFNPELRWIDVVNEIAFVAMDLEFRGLRGHGWRFVNRYCQATGDFEGLALLRYFVAYRALVRAKVSALQVRDDPEGLPEAFGNYLALAERWVDWRRPWLMITHGLSGSGKSTVAGRVSEVLPAIWLRSDLERKRLFGLAPTEDSGSSVGGGIYTTSASEQTYRRLASLAEILLRAGLPVIVDASFLQADWRQTFRDLAQAAGSSFVIIDCVAATDVLERRIANRLRAGTDPSEADLAVLKRQLATRDPLTDEEQRQTLRLDTQQSVDETALGAILRKRLQLK
ncbi:MAG TPA: aminoglycoside phosphotransferase [Gammaproteobacteria bacterium]|nr:aminoglycoside phosphotransferase [Gammaproteobacteria bacterium]